MPLHSVQQKIHQTPFAFKNASVFKEWAHENNIQIISMKGFPVQDSDFPDYWHMSKELKEEFTQALLKKL